jgi:hypothetical protein
MSRPNDQETIDRLSKLADTVATRACNKAKHSWEYGAASEALLELYNPELSVFGADPFPDGKLPSIDPHSIRALQFVRPFIQTSSHILIDGDGEL